jgi:glycosyltransferase involved in cell wall biosynthesis
MKKVKNQILNRIEKMKNNILVIIPAYNEEESIEKVVSNLENNFPFYDYVVINDGSKDATSEICHKNGFNIIDLPENLGLTGAVQTGFKYALKNGYEKAVQFDGDGQHLPEYIKDLSVAIDEGNDCVIGSRFVNAININFFFFNWLVWQMPRIATI